MKNTSFLSKRGTAIPMVALACLLLLPAGCSFAPHYARPAIPTPAAFKELTPEQAEATIGWKVAEPKDDKLHARWWDLFHDPGLAALEDRASVSNQTVAAALANFLAARAVVKQNLSDYFPTVTAGPAVTRSRQPASRAPAGSSAGPATLTEYALPFDAAWEPDLWGRIRNSVRSASLEAQATRADLENARLAVQAEAAADYFQIRVLDKQKQLLEEAVRDYRASLELTQVRRNTGIASDQDVAQAETQVNTTLAQAADVGIQRAQLEHAIATLLGEPASTFSLMPCLLPLEPVVTPVGVPSQLLERRPDIAAAERRVAEANAQIGVARAAYFPAFTLSGTVGYQSASLNKFVSGPNFVWSVGSALAETIFDAGKRKAVTEQAWANYERIVANYRQTVLAAFQDVEDNLSTLRILAEEIHEQDAAVTSSQRYLALATDRYRLGIDGYLNVITAQTLLLANQRTAIGLRMQQMTASVQLIKALGGGWADSQEGLGTAGQCQPPAAGGDAHVTR